MANVWLIDFAKTILLPEDMTIDHNSKWKVGNHEDGYLIGVNNLISIFTTILEQQQQQAALPPPSILENPPEPPEETQQNNKEGKELET